MISTIITNANITKYSIKREGEPNETIKVELAVSVSRDNIPITCFLSKNKSNYYEDFKKDIEEVSGTDVCVNLMLRYAPTADGANYNGASYYLILSTIEVQRRRFRALSNRFIKKESVQYLSGKTSNAMGDRENLRNDYLNNQAKNILNK